MHHRLRIAAAACVAAAAVVSAAPVAHAEVPTCGTPSNYHAGYFNPSDASVEGTYAVITTRYGAVCDTDTSANNFTNQYAMIASGNFAGWAQDGYIRWYGSSIYFFAQQSSGHTLNTKYGTTALATGTSYHYYNHWDPTCTCMQDIIDRTLYLASSWNPFSTWTYPFSPQFTGEARYLASDLSGTATAPASYTGVSGQSTSTDAWSGYPCSRLSATNDGSARRVDGKAWRIAMTTCPSFNIYTG